MNVAVYVHQSLDFLDDLCDFRKIHRWRGRALERQRLAVEDRPGVSRRISDRRFDPEDWATNLGSKVDTFRRIKVAICRACGAAAPSLVRESFGYDQPVCLNHSSASMVSVPL